VFYKEKHVLVYDFKMELSYSVNVDKPILNVWCFGLDHFLIQNHLFEFNVLPRTCESLLYIERTSNSTVFEIIQFLHPFGTLKGHNMFFIANNISFPEIKSFFIEIYGTSSIIEWDKESSIFSSLDIGPAIFNSTQKVLQVANMEKKVLLSVKILLEGECIAVRNLHDDKNLILVGDIFGNVFIIDLDEDRFKEELNDWTMVIGGDENPMAEVAGVGNLGGGGGEAFEGNPNAVGIFGERIERELTDEELNPREVKPKVEISPEFLKIHKNALAAHMQMKISEIDTFENILENIKLQVSELRAILSSIETKSQERTWINNQSTGDFDDKKLVEGVVGEQLIYKKRGEKIQEMGALESLPNFVHFIFDVSASMSRYNSYDGRLDRTLEASLMVMEAFRGFDRSNKWIYKISGHSGEGPNVEFKRQNGTTQMPSNRREEFELLNLMKIHASHCISGDSTISGLKHAIDNSKNIEAEKKIIVLLSDANVIQYGIKNSDLKEILEKEGHLENDVSAFIIFIGTLQDQAERLMRGVKNVYCCLKLSELPLVIKKILVSAIGS
jgi:hypothetical protein